MPVENKMVKGTYNCTIKGDLRIWEVAEVWKALHPIIGESKAVVLDLKAVTACDGAGLQIICQLLRVAEDPEKKVTILGASDAVQSAMQLGGFSEEAIKTIKGEA